MPKDYKGYTSRSAGRSSGKKNRWLLWLLLIIILLVIGFAGYWYSKHHTTKPARQSLPVKISVTPKTPDEPQIKFEFYNLLPKEKVVVQDTAVSSAPPPPMPAPPTNKPVNNPTVKEPLSPVAPANNYIIQIASLKDQADADKMKAELLLQSFPAQISKNTLNGVVWYRIQVGPYSSTQEATAALAELKANHFDGMIKKYS
jgi:cell division protein FtsN